MERLTDRLIDDGTCIDVLIEGGTSIKVPLEPVEGTTIDGPPGPYNDQKFGHSLRPLVILSEQMSR